MTRRLLIAGNWKMNTRRASAVALARDIRDGLTEKSECEVAVCPPSVYLEAVVAELGQSTIGVGGQNLCPESDGAFTGEVNAAMLLDVGCRYVILGHSERRQLMGESDAEVAAKCRAALDGGLVPIVCVGETQQEREAGDTEAVVARQIRGSLDGLSRDDAAKIVIAYEPVWAIGTGLTATPEQAEAVHAFIRSLLGELFGGDAAERIQIQYGGSVKPGNASELLGQPNIDGALVGGASLKADDFLQIIAAASNSSCVL